jgi:protein gp37
MADKTGIEWTDDTWNPLAGCSIVSPACTNCYAMEMASRLANMVEAHKAANGGDPGPLFHYEGLTEDTWKGKAVWTGKVVQAPEHILTQPLRWKRPRRIFVNSMSDLFHETANFSASGLKHQDNDLTLTHGPRACAAFDANFKTLWGQ